MKEYWVYISCSYTELQEYCPAYLYRQGEFIGLVFDTPEYLLADLHKPTLYIS